MYNKKGTYLFSDQNNWLKFSVSGLFTLLPLPNLDYIIGMQIKSWKHDTGDSIATLQNFLA